MGYAYKTVNTEASIDDRSHFNMICPVFQALRFIIHKIDTIDCGIILFKNIYIYYTEGHICVSSIISHVGSIRNYFVCIPF